jgi:hypothetical protein
LKSPGSSEIEPWLLSTGECDAEEVERLVLNGCGSGRHGEGLVGALAVTFVLCAQVARSAMRL